MANLQEQYAIKPVHDILYVNLNGSWGMDCTHDYAAEYKRQVSRYFAREWACVINLKKLDMLISEKDQIQAFKALNTWSYIKGMKAMAIIVSPDSRSHMLYQFEEIFEDKPPYAKAVFEGEIEANHWLADQGFSEKLLLQSQKSA